MAASTTAAAVAKVTATITGTAGQAFSTIFHSPPAATKAAASSIFDPSHPNPTTYDPTDPVVLFILQAFVIVGFSRLLAFFLAKMRQPRVISEVLAGIVIGPSALGRIKGFTAHIFPPTSIPNLTLVANIGLILFLFLVGLEVDFSLFRKNFKASASISAVGMAVPFGLGAAVSVGVYNRFVDDSKVKFGTFLLFIGTANAITAFPVLARILSDLRMLQDHVGVIVLSAGVGNDVVGWILLALAIALVNASSGIIILYIILTSIAWILTLWFLVRPLLVWMCRKTGSFGERGPTQTMTCLVIFLVFVSAWLTDRIGIHAIFGGFLVGLIIPHEIRSSLTEKIEDLVTVLFLPIYFALSGLKTDLGLLANGSIWGWTVCVIIVAFASKFLSCGLVAKANGMTWRESGAVGSLMACKGLVELIVLNIGLNAGILNNEVFAMFVVMALLTTFATTPLTLAFYSHTYRSSRAKDRREAALSSLGGQDQTLSELSYLKTRFSVVLEQFDHLPPLFAFCRLVKAPVQLVANVSRAASASDIAKEKGSDEGDLTVTQVAAEVKIDALRLIELTDRTSALLRASESQETLRAADSLSQVFEAFSRGNGIATSTALSIENPESYSTSVVSHAEEHSSDMILLPWALPRAKTEDGIFSHYIPNPLESLFRSKGATREGSSQYASLVRQVFADANCDVGLFLSRGTEAEFAAPGGRNHMFFAFHGGIDDRACLDFVIQTCGQNPGATADILRVTLSAEPTADDHSLTTTANTRDVDPETPILFSQLTIHGSGGATDTVYPSQEDYTSQTEDDVALQKYFGNQVGGRSNTLMDALSRINFITASTIQPLHLMINRARTAELSCKIPFVVVAGRGRRNAHSYTNELGQFIKTSIDAVKDSIVASTEVRRSLGDVGVAFVVSGVGNCLLLIQGASGGRRRQGKSKNS